MADSETSSQHNVTVDQLAGAHAMRAIFYMHMFDVLSEAYSKDKAVELMSQAAYRLGADMGEKLAPNGPDNVKGLTEQFLNNIPCKDQLFAPEVLKCDDDGMEIQFHSCPLKDTWVAVGREGDELAMLCKAAGTIDAGMFEKAGFTFEGKTWLPGQSGCCRLVVKPGQ